MTLTSVLFALAVVAELKPWPQDTGVRLDKSIPLVAKNGGGQWLAFQFG